MERARHVQQNLREPCREARKAGSSDDQCNPSQRASHGSRPAQKWRCSQSIGGVESKFHAVCDGKAKPQGANPARYSPLQLTPKNNRDFVRHLHSRNRLLLVQSMNPEPCISSANPRVGEGRALVDPSYDLRTRSPPNARDTPDAKIQPKLNVSSSSSRYRACIFLVNDTAQKLQPCNFRQGRPLRANQASQKPFQLFSSFVPDRVASRPPICSR